MVTVRGKLKVQILFLCADFPHLNTDTLNRAATYKRRKFKCGRLRSIIFNLRIMRAFQKNKINKLYTSNQSISAANFPIGTRERKRQRRGRVKAKNTNAHVSDCINRVYVIHLRLHKFPNGRLNFRVDFRNIACVYEIVPRLRQTVQRVESFVRVLGVDVGRLRFWNAVSHVLVQQLTQLVLLGVLQQFDF